MAGYYTTTVVEITIAVGIGMIEWRDTLNSRVNQIGWQEAWYTLM